MTDPKPSSAYLAVTNPEAARLLTDWRERRLLEPFMTSPKTVGEAARALGLKLNAMHHRVKRFERLGLLRVTEERKRAGRPSKLYGPPAEAFLIPFEATPNTSLEGMLTRLGALDLFVRNVARTLEEQAQGWAVLVAPDDEGGVGVRLTPLTGGVPTPIPLAVWLGADLPALLSGATVLLLNHATAKRLQRELVEILERYEGEGGAAGQPYLLLLGLTPTEQG